MKKKTTLIYYSAILTCIFSLLFTFNTFAQGNKERTPEKINKGTTKSKLSLVSAKTLAPLSSIALASGSIAVAENTTYNAYTVEELVNNLLISGCLETSNIRFGYYRNDNGNWANHSWSNNAGKRQLGYFNQASSSFPIDEGIIFSTGEIASAEGPNDSGSITDEMNMNASDPDLASITGRTMHDASVLEFDFVPNGNVIEFKFVFASDEYLEYVGTKYNDAFGFFLSGAGISGSYSNNAINLAVLPNGDAVTIGNIHSAGTNIEGVTFPAKNDTYYLNNLSGSLTMEFDGSTVVLTATHAVTPGQTYKIRMAIADASDQKWDAGVFLKARSFSTNTLVVNDPMAVCAPETVDLTAAAITAGSSAGLDLSYFEDASATIPYATPALATEGTYYIKATDPVSGCSDIEPVVVIISTVEVAEIVSEHNDLICIGTNDGSFKVEASGGISPYSYSIDNIDFSNASGEFTGLSVGSYSVYAKDVNGCEDLIPLIIVISQPGAEVCQIKKTDCPPLDLAEVCSDGDGGTPVFWTPPQFSYSCCTAGSGGDPYSFFMEFDLPESALGANCWEFNYAQRIGADNLRLFQSTGSVGSKYTDSYFISPKQYFYNSSGGTAINIDLIDVTAMVNWRLDVLDPNTNAVLHSYSVTGIISDGQQTLTIPDSVANGVYKLKFNFSSSNASGGDKIEVDKAYYNATIVDTDCAGGINFAVISTYVPGYEFLVGSTEVTYTATLSLLDEIPTSKECVFNVIVNDASTPTGDTTQTFCTIDFPTVGSLVAIGNDIKWYNDAISIIPLDGLTALNDGQEYYATQTVGSCESTTRLKVMVAIGDPSVPTGDSSQSFCSSDNPTVGNLGAAGSTIIWYAEATGRAHLNLVDLLVDGEDYFATQTVDGCESDERFKVTVTINDSPVALGFNIIQPTCTVSTGSVELTGLPSSGNWIINPGGISGSGLIYTISNLIADTTYNYTVTNDNGCISPESADIVIIAQPDSADAPIITSVLQPACYGGNGSFTISNYDASYIYTFIPNTGVTNINEVVTAPNGTYTVTASIGVCISDPSATVTITEPVVLTASGVELSAVSCFGGNDGSASVTPAGGTAPYTITESTTGLSEGIHTFNITDDKGCTTTVDVTITEPVVLTASGVELSAVSCFGGNDGSASVTPAGGTAPYTITESTTGLSEGIHTFNITDDKGCTTTVDVTITEPVVALSASITSSTNVLCKGGVTGAAMVTATDGTSGYSYLWSDGQTGATATGLLAGNYTVTVTDSNGCKVEDIPVAITEPLVALSASITTSTNVLCKGEATGAATVTATDGTSGYSYLWSDGQTGATATGLVVGNYTVMVTDANGCKVEDIPVVITEPSAPLSVIVASQVDVLCTGNDSGSINLEVVGGTAPYTYIWNTSEITEDLTSLISGSYSVVVTDANGCTAVGNTTISEPATVLSFNISKIDATTSQGCSNGEATVSPSGGTAPYTYLWSSSVGSATTVTAIGLPNGNHSVTVTDANGCESVQSFVIECVNTCDAEIVIDSITNVLCTGDTTGEGVVSAASKANPSATFTFTWSTGQIDSGVTTSTLENLSAGVYTVSVIIDGTVCQAVEDNITISEPSNVLEVTASSTDELGPSTGDGTVTASVTGGVAPYSYAWSNGETTKFISGLSAGDYSVSVIDTNGCEDSITVKVNPGECHNLSISGTTTPVVCFGESNGSVSASVSGGTGPFSYFWDTLSDTTLLVSGLSAGDYTVTVLDEATQCTTSTTLTINQPSNLSSGTAATHIQCKGEATGSIDLTVIGGTAPYTFSWSNNSTEEDVISAIAGTYSVVITDANGCVTENSTTILEPAAIVSVEIDSQINVDCKGDSTGSVTVVASGGISPYSYLWNDTLDQTTVIAVDLIAGNYTVLVTDANGCTSSIDVIIEEPSAELSAELTAVDALSATDCTNGSSTVTVLGGTVPYTYVWSNGEASKTALSLDEGTHSVTITDANGCSITEEVIISCRFIDAINDMPTTAINGLDGGAAVLNVLDNDTLNGGSVSLSEVTLTELTADPTGVLTLNSDGTVDVASGTAEGVYELEYQLCEVLNPSNCDTAIVRIVVEAAVIVAADDIPSTPINGLDGGTAVLNVLDNDTLNGGSVSLSEVTLTELTADPTGVLTLNSDGTVDVASGTAEGVYELEYQLCEVLNPSNCDTAIVRIVVEAAVIVAADDMPITVINGLDGGTAVLNVLDNDTLNGGSVSLSEVTLTELTADPTGVLTLNSDGTVDVAYGTAEGVYELEYQLCEVLNPSNCDTAIVRIVVEAAVIVAADDMPTTAINGLDGGAAVLNVLDNDTLNGGSVSLSEVTLTELIADPTGVLILNSDGTVDVAFGTAEGVYELEYQLCEVLNPSNCDTAIVRIVVEAPEIDAIDDTISDVNGINGATNVINVLDNDTLNNSLVNLNDVTLAIVDADVTGYVTLNADGSIDILDGTPEGVYTVTYSICEIANKGNCDTAVVTINVICNSTKISGFVINDGTNAPLANVPVTLIPNNGTEGPILLMVTGANGYYNFTGFIPGDYIIQVQDANLNTAYNLYNVNSSLSLLSIDNCNYIVNDFTYDKSDLLILGNFVWYDVNSNGVQDEWYDANDDGVVTENIPDANGYVDYSAYEWIDFNGDGSYEGASNEGELNAAGFGSTTTTVPNIYVTGPNGFSKEVILGIQGYWRTRAPLNEWGEYEVRFDFESGIEAAAVLMREGGLVKVLPSALLPKSSKLVEAQTEVICGVTTDDVKTAQLTVIESVDNTIDFGVQCKMFVAGLNLEVPVNVTVECSADISSISTGIAVATTDSTCEDIVITEVDSAVSGCGSAMVITRTWTATDNCGRTVSADQIITVVDTTAPQIVDAPESEITVTCSEIPEPAVIVALDDCSSNIQINFEETMTDVDNNGVYQIIRLWDIIDECDNTNMFTQTITVEPLDIQIENIMNVCTGDGPIDLYTLISGIGEESGTWVDNDNSRGLASSIFDPFGIDVGEYHFTYTSGSEACFNAYVVTVIVNDDCEVLPCESPDNIIISKAVTANNDGINDTFVISDVSECGFVSAVKIFSRWGKMVYESNNYNNNWGGYHDNSGPTIGSGNKLPAGTYYYIVNIVGSGYKPMTGYIYLGTN